MKKQYNVLIVPAGSGIAVAAIKSLRRDQKIKVISADVNKLAPGLYISHKGYLVPPFSDVSFFFIIKEISKKEKVDVIIPALDTILYDFSNRKEGWEKIGVKVLISLPETIKITRDKWRTYLKLKEVIPLPRSFIRKEDIDIDFPLLIKPRDGSGSKDIHKVTSREELDFFYRRVPNPIIQEYLEGKEYTIDCLTNMDGNLLLYVCRERIEIKAGVSVKGRIIQNKMLESFAEKLSEKIKFCGPFFFQVKEDKNGVPKLTEINPRISGTMSFSSFSGPNIHSLAVRTCMGEKVAIPPKKNHRLYISRYWEDVYLTENQIERFLERIGE